MFVYDTALDAMNGLKARGFTMDFNLAENCLICNSEKFHPEDFSIVEIHRFEGESNPSDESIVYAIESTTGLKGVLMNGYGMSADTMSSEMAKKLEVNVSY